jgi:hypothetical protein
VAIDKIQSESINLADTFAFTGTVTGAGGVNTPAFLAQLSANTTIANDSYVKVACNTEVFDTDGNYDNSSNYRFTPTTAGKYYVFGSVTFNSPTNFLQYVNTHIYKNGSMVSSTGVSTYNNNYIDSAGQVSSIILDMNGSSDYVELYAVGGGTSTVGLVGTWTLFGAYKIIE